MATRVMLFTGAPEAVSLDWNVDNLTVPLLPYFAGEEPMAVDYPIVSSDVSPAWRSIPLTRMHLPTGLTQAERVEEDIVGCPSSFDPDETTFLDKTHFSFESSVNSQATDVVSAEAEDSATSFYEQSYLLHEDLLSSQIVGLQSGSITSSATATSNTSSFGLDSSLEPNDQSRSIPMAGSLSNLKDIPNAVYLRSINPQTMTVNLIVGVISVPQPRIIKTRRGGRAIELIEMTVGDETKAGFGINIWLQPHASEEDNISRTVRKLRPRDVILIRNVALSTFRTNVYGQSLRKGMTKVDLLYRNVLNKHDEAGVYKVQELEGNTTNEAQSLKTKNVKDWVTSFVSVGEHVADIGKKPTERRIAQLRLIPPDTP